MKTYLFVYNYFIRGERIVKRGRRQGVVVRSKGREQKAESRIEGVYES